MIDDIVKEIRTKVSDTINLYIDPLKVEYKLTNTVPENLIDGYIDYLNQSPFRFYFIPDKSAFERVSISHYEQQQLIDIYIVCQRATQQDLYLQCQGYFKALFQSIIYLDSNMIDEIEITESEYFPDINGDINKKSMQMTIRVKSEC